MSHECLFTCKANTYLKQLERKIILITKSNVRCDPNYKTEIARKWLTLTLSITFFCWYLLIFVMPT